MSKSPLLTTSEQQNTAEKGRKPCYSGSLRSKKTLCFASPASVVDRIDAGSSSVGQKRKISVTDVFSPPASGRKGGKRSTERDLRLISKEFQDSINECDSPDASPVKSFQSSGLAIEIVDTYGLRRSILVGEGWSIGDLIEGACGVGHAKVIMTDMTGRTLDRSDVAGELSRMDTYYMSREG